MADLPDWSPDGKSLFYIAYPAVPNRSKFKDMYDKQHPWIATLNCREIADTRGLLLPKFGPTKALVEVLAAESSRVRCLPDGSVAFNSKQRDFPSVKKAEPRGCLFKLSPDFRSVEPIVALHKEPGDEELGDQLASFEPNQDGTKIAVPGSHGEITVVDVLSGKVTQMEKDGKTDLKFTPQWRTKDELCYPSRNTEKPPNGHDVDVVLQSLTDPNRRSILSKEWDATSVEFLKDHEKPDQKNSPCKNNKGQG
jgi:hypothetical protein